MTRTIQHLRGTTAQNNVFTGAAGEITVDTQTHEMRVHDGSTQGGHIIYTKSDVDTALSNKANVALDNLTNAGTEVIAHNAMPSSKYDNLTLGASGATYTAPADGWLFLNKTQGTANTRIEMYNQSSTQRTLCIGSSATGQWIYGSMQAKKGDVIEVVYSVTGSTNAFKFIYAQGAK